MNSRQIPRALLDAIASGEWHQPRDATVRALVPFDDLPFDFRLTITDLSCDGLGHLATHTELPEQFHVYASRQGHQARPLPWIDVDRAVVIADGRIPGADSGIVLDLRTSSQDPSVVASNWERQTGVCLWQEIAPSFSSFVQVIRSLDGSNSLRDRADNQY